MHRATVLLLALGFGLTALPAQSASQNEPQVVVQKSSTAPDGSTVWTTLSPMDAQAVIHRAAPPYTCPVMLAARQSSAAFARQVRGGEAPGGGEPIVKQDGDVAIKDVTQRLHLSARGPDSKRIVAAGILVHGYSNKARFMPIFSTDKDYDAAKILNVRFSPESAHEDSADVSVPGLAAVGVIDLNSVTFADGSTWKIAQGQSCRVWVDGLMLVSGR